jgi:acyl dehydratase
MAEPGDPFRSAHAASAGRPKTVVIEQLPAPAKLYARALSGILKRGRETHLPALRLVRPAVALDPGPIWRYSRVCGFIPEHGVPLTYPHLLAFPLHLLMLTDPAFPWPALGLVHLANRVRLRRPLAYKDLLRVEVEFGALLRHDKGQAFVLHTRMYRRGEAVWDGDSVYLKRGVPASGSPLDPLELGHDALQRISRWQLPPQLGRDYASVSGDYNPIHLTALSAKVFGFPRNAVRRIQTADAVAWRGVAVERVAFADRARHRGARHCRRKTAFTRPHAVEAAVKHRPAGTRMFLSLYGIEAVCKSLLN